MGEVGRLITEAMDRLEISQNQLSKISGVGSSGIGKIIRGVTNPQIETLEKLADPLGLDPKSLMEAARIDLLTRQEAEEFDAVPASEVEAYLEALRMALEEPERDKGVRLLQRLKKVFNPFDDDA